MPYEMQGVFWVLCAECRYRGQDQRAGILPRRPKARMNRAIRAHRFRFLRFWQRGSLCRIARVGFWIIGVGNIFLRHGAEINDSIRNTICAPKSDYDTPAPVVLCAVVQSHVAAAIAHEGAGVEGRDELEGGEVGAAAGAGEGVGDAGCADAVGDVHYAGEFLELGEEVERYVGGVGVGLGRG